jgi:hypothetical protein
MFSLKLELEVDDEPERLIAERGVGSLREVVALTTDFLERFGESDKGPQVIRVTLVSRP